MDTAQWPQGIGVVKSGGENPSKPGEKKPRPQAVNCPRCNSTNTKFCYYNNYSLTQPRYFCKTCRRYWTEGGSLRNVPVGGGTRKNKRSSSTSNSAPSKKVFPDLTAHNFSSPNPKIHEGHDLNLAYNPSQFNRMSEFVSAPFDGSNLNPDSSASHNHFPVMELFKTGNMASGGFSSLLSGPLTDSNSVYASSGFPVSTEFKPSLGFSENYGNINRSAEEDHTNSSRILFPFEELKPVSNGEFEQDRGGETTNGYWNGMLGSW